MPLFLYICKMEIKKINITGNDYPIFMGLNAVTNIMKAMQWDDFTKLSEVVNPLVLMKLSKHAAFEGISNACRIQGENNPFTDADHLADAIQSFDELSPAVEMFTEACKSFFLKKETKKTATAPKQNRQTRSR